MQPKLTTSNSTYKIIKLHPLATIPIDLQSKHFISITRSSTELSIICKSNTPITSEQSNDNWSYIKTIEPLAFTEVGILADILTALRLIQISILSISTFDSDYIFVNSSKLNLAKKSLIKSGYIFENN